MAHVLSLFIKISAMKKYFLKPNSSNIWILGIGAKSLAKFEDKESGLENCGKIIEKEGGGALTIMCNDGTFEEERTYPGKIDPPKRKG
jgi:hypothetical protein